MKAFAAISALFLSLPVFAAPTPADVFESLVPTLQKYPDIKQIEICTPEGFCEIFLPEFERRGGAGSGDIIYERPNGQGNEAGGGGVAGAVSEIVGSAGKAVGVGGRITVEYEQTKKDGSKVKVKVEASFGVGAGAAAGASPSAADSK